MIRNTPNLGGKEYFITFIDDYNEYYHIYLISFKEKVLYEFYNYKCEIKLQCENFIKCLRTNRRGEHYNPSFFEITRIKHEIIAPYTPQQNGIAKRKDRVLIEMVNVEMSNFGLNQGFRGKALLTTCNILNKISNKRSNKSLMNS